LGWMRGRYWSYLVPELRQLINTYYGQRQLKAPDALEAFLFLLSEIGELAEALQGNSDFPELDDYDLFSIFETIKAEGRYADGLVSMRGGWTRNNGRKGDLDLKGEFADCLMMLDRTAEAMGCPGLKEMLIEKMTHKGLKLA
jgi:NTP pyrophosphatase (non-canonical NTP hydrolase)